QGADHHARGDLVVRQALGDQDDCFTFAAGQLPQTGRGSQVTRLGDVPVDESAGDRGREQRVTPRGDAYGVQEVLRLDVLDEEAGGAGAQRVEDVFVEAVVGQDHDVHPGQGRVRRDEPGRLDAVQHRHLDVDERDVGHVTLGESDPLAVFALSLHDVLPPR